MIREYGIEAACVCDNKFWYFSMEFNMLFCLDFISGKTKNYGPIEDLEDERRLFGAIIPYDNLLVFVPMAARYLVIFNVTSECVTKKIEILPPKRFADNYNENYKWQSATLLDDKVYMFGLSHSAIGILDCKTFELEYDEMWIDICTIIPVDRPFYWFAKQNIVYEDNIYLTSGYTGLLFKYGKDKKMECFNLGCDHSVYKIGIINDLFFAISTNSEPKLMVFDKYGNVRKMLNLSEEYVSSTPLAIGDSIVINPLIDAPVLCFSEDKRLVTNEIERTLGPMYFLTKNQSKYICYSNWKKKIVVLDKELRLIEDYSLLYDDLVENHYMDLYKNRVFCYLRKEDSIFGLEDLIYYLTSCE